MKWRKVEFLTKNNGSIHMHPYTLSLFSYIQLVVYFGTIPRGEHYQPLWCFSGPTLITVQGPQTFRFFPFGISFFKSMVLFLKHQQPSSNIWLVADHKSQSVSKIPVLVPCLSPSDSFWQTLLENHTISLYDFPRETHGLPKCSGLRRAWSAPGTRARPAAPQEGG